MGWVERARIGKLEVRENPQGKNGALAYPYPMTLDDVQIEVWSIEGSESRCNDGEHRFIHFLSNDQHGLRSTYQNLERNLRSSGDDEYADAVYCAMKRREWNGFLNNTHLAKMINRTRFHHLLPKTTHHAHHPGQAFVSWLLTTFISISTPFRSMVEVAFRSLLRYGTSPLRLFIVILVMAGVAFPVHLDGSNFEASTSALAMPESRIGPDTGYVPRKGDPPIAWNWKDALQTALKAHLPIVPLNSRDDWQPRDSGKTAWFIDGRGNCSDDSPLRVPGGLCVPFSPEDVINLFQLLNWICWPILLSYLIRRLLRNA